MSTAAEETQIPLKILVDKARNKVLLAEADYSFVDILFSFLTLPMGTILRLFGENSDSKLRSLGSFNSLYKGLANLPTECFWTEECRALLLNPIHSQDRYCSKLKLNVEDTVSESTKYFMCSKCIGLFSMCKSAKCRCGNFFSEVKLHRNLTANTSDGKEGVFVNETANFIITDDLLVKPSLIGSSIQMLIDMGITNMANVEEMTMYIGLQQVLNLFRMAFYSTNPLTDLFLGKAVNVQQLVKSGPGNLTWPLISKKTPASASNSKKINVKAFVRNSNRKLLFVQAGGDFIDFLFSFMAIPVGTVEWLLAGTTNIGPCIDNIYKSLSCLNVSQYMKSQDLKDMLLQPPLPKQYVGKNQIFTLKESTAVRFFSILRLLLKDPTLEGEFVKGRTMFIVTDDLVVTPLSSISAISHLGNMKVPLSDVVEHEVSIGIEEALKILKASLTSSSALSSGLNNHLLLKKPKQEN